MNNDKLISILLFFIFTLGALMPLINLAAVHPVLILLAVVLYPGIAAIKIVPDAIKRFIDSL